MAQYDGSGVDSPKWWPSRYGEGDEIGAGNELTPERTLAALSLPKQGRCIELAQLLHEDVPAYPPRSWHQLILAHGALEDNVLAPEGSRISYFEEHVSQTYQIGTHLDGLGHVGIDKRFYNGLHYEEIYTPKELTKLGIENVRPWVTRGVCLNIAQLHDTDMLPEGFVITPEHLEQACKEQGVEIGAGDVVLIHTGWGAMWTKDPVKYAEVGKQGRGGVEPGCGWDAAHWLTDRRVALVGADNWAFEVIPFEQDNRMFIVHQHLLTETGTHILENLTTAELAASGASEFLFVLTVQKTKGSTGAMASPVAVI